MENTGQKSFVCESNSTKVFPGYLREIKIVDQYGTFENLIQKYSTPGSLCGYLSLAVARIMVENAGMLIYESDSEEIDSLVTNCLRNSKYISLQLEEEIKHLQTLRSNYINNHPADFTPKERQNYMKDWVAGYEISERIRNFSKSEKCDILFLRHLQKSIAPDIPVRHEEAEHLAEEEVFLPNPFLIQHGQQYYDPKEFLSKIKQWKTDPQFSPIFILCLIGHYVVAKPMMLKKSANSVPIPTLLLFNTVMETRYDDTPMARALFDLWFLEKYDGTEYTKTIHSLAGVETKS
jgi:hypothetical protein